MFFAAAALMAALAAPPARGNTKRPDAQPSASPSALPAVPPVTLANAWTTVGLPAAPLGIAVHNGTIWVCGKDAMVAESSDGGRHWTVRNLKPKGGMLYAFAFFGKRAMAAFGTGRVLLRSSDGGATWGERPSSSYYGLRQAAFANAKDGYGINGSQIAWTHDGGATWNFASNHTIPLGVAALDGQHAAVIAEAKGGGQEVVMSTNDGGSRWNRIAFPKGWRLEGIFAGTAHFHLFGKQTQGAQTKPVAVYSNDGRHWEVDSALPGVPLACNQGGCLFAGGGTGGGWAVFPFMTLTYQLPSDAQEPATNGWAVSGGTFCRVSSDLRCRTGRTPWKAPAAP